MRSTLRPRCPAVHPSPRLGRVVAAKPRRHRLAAFPSSFRDELERYLRWLADPAGGTPRACQPSTIAQRRRELTLAASALAEVGGGPGHVRALRDLVEPTNTQKILEVYLPHADSRPTAFLRTLTTNLVSLARHWVRLPQDELAPLIALQHKLGTTPVGLTAATERLLRELRDPAARAALLALPATLAAQACRSRTPAARRRYLARTAVALELLLHTGMRLHQLATLRIGQHLSWPDGPEGALRIDAPGRRSRDGASQEFELTGAPQRLVEDYLAGFGARASRQRPHPPLFTDADGRPVTDAALADGIAKATQCGIGLRITPSDFRHFCALLLLEADPNDYASVKDLLGHQFLESTLALYGSRQRHAAGATWNADLAQACAPSTPPKACHASIA